jgi:hypothetical protein
MNPNFWEAPGVAAGEPVCCDYPTGLCRNILTFVPQVDLTARRSQAGIRSIGCGKKLRAGSDCLANQCGIELTA